VAEHTLLATGECIARPEFSGFTVLPVPAGKEGAANCIRINDKILMPAGFPQVYKMLIDRGEDIIEIEISEYAKIDGGLTCLSLRF
jgi:dimethylargininase